MKYKCSFMHDNHTFTRCTGSLEQIKEQLEKLWDKDSGGLWGNLTWADNKTEYRDLYIVESSTKLSDFNVKKLQKIIDKKNEEMRHKYIELRTTVEQKVKELGKSL